MKLTKFSRILWNSFESLKFVIKRLKNIEPRKSLWTVWLTHRSKEGSLDEEADMKHTGFRKGVAFLADAKEQFNWLEVSKWYSNEFPWFFHSLVPISGSPFLGLHSWIHTDGFRLIGIPNDWVPIIQITRCSNQPHQPKLHRPALVQVVCPGCSYRTPSVAYYHLLVWEEFLVKLREIPGLDKWHITNVKLVL